MYISALFKSYLSLKLFAPPWSAQPKEARFSHPFSFNLIKPHIHTYELGFKMPMSCATQRILLLAACLSPILWGEISEVHNVWGPLLFLKNMELFSICFTFSLGWTVGWETSRVPLRPRGGHGWNSSVRAPGARVLMWPWCVPHSGSLAVTFPGVTGNVPLGLFN